MTDFTVKQGHKYSAEIDLSWLESFATDDTIAERFKALGFENVVVVGSGQVRFARGSWDKPDATVDVTDPHLRAIRED
jgi:hypothetical protein